MKLAFKVLVVLFFLPLFPRQHVLAETLILRPIENARYGCKINDELGTFELIKFPRKRSESQTIKTVTPSNENRILKSKIRRAKANRETSRIVQLKKHLHNIKTLSVRCAELALKAQSDRQNNSGSSSSSSSSAGPINCDYVINSGEPLNKFSSVAQGGQTVCVKAGIYPATLRPEVSGTAGNLITFRAYPGDECKGGFAGTKTDCRAVIDGQNNRDTGADLSSRNFIRVEGFEIRNHSQHGVTNFLDWYATSYQTNGNQIVNNLIHNNAGNGVDSENSTNALIENNEITSNLTAVRLGGQLSSSNMVVRGNNIHYNNKDGIQGGGNNLLFESNVMYDQFHTDQHQDAFDIGWITNSVIRNNRISDFTQLIYGGLPNDAEVVKNWENLDIYGNVIFTDRYWTVSAGEAPGIFIDQRFISQAKIKNIKIHSNTFGWVGYGAIWLDADSSAQVSDIKIYNNIFYDSNISIIAGAQNVVSNYNLYYNVSPPSFEGANSLIGQNPQFVNYTRHVNHDFRLKSISPAINKGPSNLGSLVPLSTPFLDMAGTQRPEGISYDMGAFEYKAP